MKKATITEIQRMQFNRMRSTLIQISKNYQTAAQLRKNSEKDYGLEFDEAIEMAYEDIQMIAKSAVKGVKQLNNES